MDIETYDPDEYQRATARFDNHQPEVGPPAFVFGLTAEAGEVAGWFEKAARYHGELMDVNDLKLELGDVLWNVARLADYYGWTMSEVMQANIDKLHVRYAERGLPVKEAS